MTMMTPTPSLVTDASKEYSPNDTLAPTPYYTMPLASGFHNHEYLLDGYGQTNILGLDYFEPDMNARADAPDTVSPTQIYTFPLQKVALSSASTVSPHSMHSSFFDADSNFSSPSKRLDSPSPIDNSAQQASSEFLSTQDFKLTYVGKGEYHVTRTGGSVDIGSSRRESKASTDFNGEFEYEAPSRKGKSRAKRDTSSRYDPLCSTRRNSNKGFFEVESDFDENSDYDFDEKSKVMSRRKSKGNGKASNKGKGKGKCRAKQDESPRSTRVPRRLPPSNFVGFRFSNSSVFDVDIVNFPRFYRLFAISTAFSQTSFIHEIRRYFEAEAAGAKKSTDFTPLMAPPAGSRWNKAIEPLNLYHPRYVLDIADLKLGLCPHCVEPPSRGGDGQARWFKLKNSSYVYHLSYAHGINCVTGLPFTPPLRYQHKEVKDQKRNARQIVRHGLCHKCCKWIQVESVKNVKTVVPELFWWKHAKRCHGGCSPLPEEGLPYLQDDIYEMICRRNPATTPLDSDPKFCHPATKSKLKK